MNRRKDMKRTGFKAILQSRYRYEKISFCGEEAMAALLYIDEVEEAVIVPSPFSDVVIANYGFVWLEIAIANEFWWLTVMYNQHQKVVQYYFDITDGNHENGDNPYFDDMYLDVVVNHDGKFMIVDQEELENAYFRQEITTLQYHRAKKSCNRLVNYLSFHMKELMEQCQSVYCYLTHIDRERT